MMPPPCDRALPAFATGSRPNWDRGVVKSALLTGADDGCGAFAAGVGNFVGAEASRNQDPPAWAAWLAMRAGGIGVIAAALTIVLRPLFKALRPLTAPLLVFSATMASA